MQFAKLFRFPLIAFILGLPIGHGETSPTIAFSASGGNSVISWPSSAVGWQLCSASNLTDDNSQIVPIAPIVVSSQNVVTLPMAGDHQFYQLRKEGALLPFTTLEAEAAGNITTGTIVKMTGPPTNNVITPEMEASGRGYVELNATGQFLDFPSVPAANTIVIRHCIPDAPTGGGLSGTLSLYVNGVFRQKITLTSKFNWLYGAVGQNGQSNDPTAGSPHVFWDETRAFITGEVQTGDTLRLCKDADDTASYYRIDLVDLEKVAPPLSPPPPGTYLSIADYGADGTDLADDTTAIQNCLTDAKATGKIVWMPPGTYYQSALFTLDGVVVRGAGMWYTNLIGTVAGTHFAGNVGFLLKGSGSSISDLYVESSVHTTRSTQGGKPFTSYYNTCSNWKVSNVWITHMNVGFWMSGANNGVVRGCRVRSTYADGININRGSCNNLVELNHVRGAGDDGIALSSETYNTPTISQNNTVRSNTVIANWSGHNFDLAGGSGHLVEDNYFADSATCGCLTINMPSNYQMYPLTGAIIRRNTVVRGGGLVGSQKRGSIWIYPGSQTISNVYIQDNNIVDSFFSAVDLAGTYNQQITFSRNIADNPGDKGFLVESQVIGSGLFETNICRNQKSSAIVSFVNNSANYTVISTGNSWP